MSTRDPRLGTHARRRLTLALKRDAILRGRGCERPDCRHPDQPIDYTARPGEPLAFEVDEIIPRALGGDPLDPRNVRPSHAVCNRGAGSATAAATRTPPRPLDADDW